VRKDPLKPKHCAEMLAALAAPERLRIVSFLREGPRNVTEVADMLQVPPVNASHHLMKLRAAGLIQSRRKGRFVVYSLAPDILSADPAEHLDLGCCRLELPPPE
jgi:DNA-binding transcriptional ArsR family regulator